MPTGQLRFYVTLAFAVDVNGSQGGGDTCSVVPQYPCQDGLGLASPRDRVSIEALRKEVLMHVGEHQYKAKHGAAGYISRLSQTLLRSPRNTLEAGELEKIRAGKAVTTTENSGVVRIAQYPEMACFLVRDFPLGRRPHKAIPKVVGQRGLEEFAVKVQGSG